MPFFRAFVYRYGNPYCRFLNALRLGVCPEKMRADYEGKENYCESKVISKTDLRKVQDH